jgi:hypothetical protein
VPLHRRRLVVEGARRQQGDGALADAARGVGLADAL